MNLWADAVLIDVAANAIRLHVPGLEAGEESTGLLDVGANGRLLGIEIGPVYVHVMESLPGQESYVRTAVVDVTMPAERPDYVVIPRRGTDYEITWPSGNECWRVTTVNGTLIRVCATTGDAHAAPGDDRARKEGSGP